MAYCSIAGCRLRLRDACYKACCIATVHLACSGCTQEPEAESYSANLEGCVARSLGLAVGVGYCHRSSCCNHQTTVAEADMADVTDMSFNSCNFGQLSHHCHRNSNELACSHLEEQVVEA